MFIYMIAKLLHLSRCWCSPYMTYLFNMISGKIVVIELTTRISGTKTNPKFAKTCYISLFFYQIPVDKTHIWLAL